MVDFFFFINLSEIGFYNCVIDIVLQMIDCTEIPVTNLIVLIAPFGCKKVPICCFLEYIKNN